MGYFEKKMKQEKIELVARPDGDCECDGTRTGFGQRASLIFCAIHRNNGFLLKKTRFWAYSGYHDDDHNPNF